MQCPACDTWDTYEITTFESAHQRFICRNGHSFMDVCERPAPPMGRMHGPAVPTPEEILEGAGLSPLIV